MKNGVILTTCLKWNLYTMLIRFQAHNPPSEVSIKRDQHFKREFWLIVFYIVLFTALAVLQLSRSVVAIVFNATDQLAIQLDMFVVIRWINLIQSSMLFTLVIISAVCMIYAGRRYCLYEYGLYRKQLLLLMLMTLISCVNDCIQSIYELVKWRQCEVYPD